MQRARTLKAIGENLGGTTSRGHGAIESAVILIAHCTFRIINLHALDTPRSEALPAPTALQAGLATERVAARNASSARGLGARRRCAVQTRALELLHRWAGSVDVIARRIGVGGAGGAVACVGER